MKYNLNKYEGSHKNTNIHINIYHENIRRYQHPQNNLWGTFNKLFKFKTIMNKTTDSK